MRCARAHCTHGKPWRAPFGQVSDALRCQLDAEVEKVALLRLRLGSLQTARTEEGESDTALVCSQVSAPSTVPNLWS